MIPNNKDDQAHNEGDRSLGGPQDKRSNAADAFERKTTITGRTEMVIIQTNKIQTTNKTTNNRIKLLLLRRQNRLFGSHCLHPTSLNA
jgi:hypothetical protein